MDLLEEDFIFAFIAAIEFIILLNNIDIQDDNDALLDQKSKNYLINSKTN